MKGVFNNVAGRCQSTKTPVSSVVVLKRSIFTIFLFILFFYRPRPAAELCN
jgi:hypothetical protein